MTYFGAWNESDIYTYNVSILSGEENLTHELIDSGGVTDVVEAARVELYGSVARIERL